MAKTGSPQIDPFRSVVLDVLKDKVFSKRNELIAEAKARGVNVADALFMRVMKPLCAPRPGGFWGLKEGMDDY